MFLKINWDNKIKKVSLGQVKDASDLFTLISRATDIPVSQFAVRFVDGEDDPLTIRDNLDFEYFLSCGADGKYKSVSVTREDGSFAFPMLVEKVTEAPAQESRLEHINTELRPYRALGVYRGIEEFVHHFDDALTFRTEAPKTLTKEVHSGIICDACNKNNISGKRFKCLVCPDFDICEECEAKEAHAEHPMVRCNKKEETYLLEKLARKFGKLKKRQEKKKRINKGLHETGECQRHRHHPHSFRAMVHPFLRNVREAATELGSVIQETLAFNSQPRTPEAKSHTSESSEEKKKVLQFMYENADQQVIEELVHRFEDLNLVDFLDEIERNNRILNSRR